MENMYSNKFKSPSTGPPIHNWGFIENTKLLIYRFRENNKAFKDNTKLLTRESALIQMTFFLGYLISWSYGVYLLEGKELFPFFNDSEGWRSMSLVASFIGFGLCILAYKYLQESKEWIRWREEWERWKEEWERWKEEFPLLKNKETDIVQKIQDPGITSLLNSGSLYTLFSFWLIMSGLMYMYYSTVVAAPELFMRDNIEGQPYKAVATLESFFLIYFMPFLLAAACIAHFIPGFVSHEYWKRKYAYTNKDSDRFTRIVNFLIDFKIKGRRAILKLIGKQLSRGRDSQEHNEEFRNVDVRIIISLAFYLIPIGIFGSVFLILQHTSLQDNIHGMHARFVYFLYTFFVILVANAGFALVQSLLPSRFPVHLRNTGSGLAYNGGLVIAFASPFIIMEFYLKTNNEYVIFVAMILGAASMVIGGLRLMRLPKEYANTE